MNNIFTISTILLFSISISLTSVYAQTLVSRFDFDAYPLTSAAIGPDGSTVNPNALTDGTGVHFDVGGPNVGLDLVFPATSLLSTLNSMDLRIEFARNENEAWLFEGGNISVYVSAGSLYFEYYVQRNPNNNNNPEQVTLQFDGLATSSSGAFREIRAVYDASIGYGSLLVDDIPVASQQGAAGRNLVWGNPSSFMIGRRMDGGGNNFVTLGSMVLYGGAVVALPVELISFSAYKRHQMIELKWTTATELNNYGFEVQRSFDGTNWDMLGFVNGHGTANSPRHYAFSDPASSLSAESSLYYRLRQIDRDGSFEYSPVVEVFMRDIQSFSVQPAYPNPFNPSTTFAVILNNDEQVTVRVHDSSGRVVAVLIEGDMLAAGMHTLAFHADDLPSGMYIASVQTSTQSASIKLLLQK